MGSHSAPLSKDLVVEQDVVVIVTNHSDIDYELIHDASDLIVDTRGYFKHLKKYLSLDTREKVTKAALGTDPFSLAEMKVLPQFGVAQSQWTELFGHEAGSRVT